MTLHDVLGTYAIGFCAAAIVFAMTCAIWLEERVEFHTQVALWLTAVIVWPVDTVLATLVGLYLVLRTVGRGYASLWRLVFPAKPVKADLPRAMVHK